MTSSKVLLKSLLASVILTITACYADFESKCALLNTENKSCIKYFNFEYEGRTEMLNPNNMDARIQYQLRAKNSYFIITRYIHEGINRDTILLNEKNDNDSIQFSPTKILDFLSENRILKVVYSDLDGKSDLYLLCGDTLTVHW